MRWTRRSVLGVLAVSMMGVAGCGAGTAAATRTPAGGARGGGSANPAMRAAVEIIRLQPVVPFTPQQVQQLVPILQALASNPNLPAAQLTAKAQQIEAVLTDTQKTALSNMGSAGGIGPGQGAGGFRRGASGLGSDGGRPGQGGRPRQPGASGTARGRSFSPGGVYQLAIDALQGTASSPNASGSPAVPGGATAGSG